MNPDILAYQSSTQVEARKPLSAVLIMVCIYIFLVIERPWESIRYLEGWPIERVFAIAMIIVAFLNNKFKIISSPTNKWVYGLLALHFILAPFAFRPGYAVDQGIEYAKMVVLYMLMLAVADDEASLKIIVKVFVFSMMFYTLHSLWEYYNGRHVWRMGISRMVGVDSTFNDPNAFGASIVLSLPFVYALLRFETKTLIRKLYYGYFVLAVICIVLTGSRSAFVALLFLNLLWIFAQKGTRKFKMLAVIVPVVLLIWTVMPAEKQNRIRTLWDESAGPANAKQSAEGRKIGWQVSWEMFKQKPFTGIGAGGNNFIGYRVANRIDEGDPIPMQSHVLYGEVLAEFGIGGVIFFAGLVTTIARHYYIIRARIPNDDIKGTFPALLNGVLLCSLLLLLIFGFGGHNFYRPLWLWIAAWSGVLIRLVNSSQLSKCE